MCDSSFRKYLKLKHSFKRGKKFNVKKNWDKEILSRYEFAMKYLYFHKVNKRFIFVDECPWNLETGIYYGWNLKGHPIKIPKHPKTSHISLIAAVYDDGLLCFRCFRGILCH